MQIEIKKAEHWFKVIKSNRSTTPLSSIIDKIDYDKYNIFKYSNNIKQLTVAEFKEFKYSGYIFFDKDIYDLDYINMWLNWLKNNILDIRYWVKPFPPIEIFNKIKIM